jgi:methenyltetrahydrofolate cyclohydrolase
MAHSPLDSSTSIATFLAATAAKQPAPGGGAVAALAGALAAAIGEMVLAYSLGRKDLAEHRPELEAAAHELLRARQLFLSMMVEDQTAFAAMTAARKAHLAEASAANAKAYDESVQACVLTPCIIADTAAAVLLACERIVPIVNHFLLSDLQVCAELAMATLRCGQHNARVNLPELRDPTQRTKIESELSTTLAASVKCVARLMPAIAMRIKATTKAK